jgi:hypothetical protein
VQLMMISHCAASLGAVAAVARCWCWWERIEGSVGLSMTRSMKL